MQTPVRARNPIVVVPGAPVRVLAVRDPTTPVMILMPMILPGTPPTPVARGVGGSPMVIAEDEDEESEDFFEANIPRVVRAGRALNFDEIE